MGLGETVQKWIFTIALKKAVKTVVGIIVSAKVLQEAGVSVDATAMETWLLASGAALATLLLNFLKVKTALGKKLL